MRILTFLTLAFSITHAQSTPAPPTPCGAEQFRQFDFWAGEWDVTGPAGARAGSNSIQIVENGCGLYESWTSANGVTGRSLNFYDPLTKQWHQSWIGGGTSLQLAGGLEGRAMVLRGESATRAGGRVLNRITWTPREDGSVRQHWEQSSDGGTTWTTAFDGYYTRRRASDGVTP
jgi:hypothetical protein